jgi:hemolysin activation/secretion protein
VSAEIRVPVNSPLSFGRFGVKGFVDAGTVWASAQRLSDQPWDRGIGGGVYFGATALMLDVDVAWPESGSPRAHVTFGVTF